MPPSALMEILEAILLLTEVERIFLNETIHVGKHISKLRI